MTYAAIMVHAEASPLAEPRLRLAAHVANLFGATLIGVGARTPHLETEAAAVDGTRVRERAARADIKAAQARFQPIASYVSGGSEWRPTQDEPSVALIRESRAADLIVMSRAGGNDLHDRGEVGDVLLGAGRPVLIARPNETRLEPCRVVVAWKDSRESRRALADALPLLKLAVRVRVVQVCEGLARSEAEAQAMDVAAALGRHGVAAEVEIMPGEAGAAARVLRSICDGWDADLLVAGGYGRPRTREWIFGGVTQELLRDFPTAVLLSH